MQKIRHLDKLIDELAKENASAATFDAQVAVNEAELYIVRRAYAKQVAAIASAAHDARIEEALGYVRREEFLGPGPWQTFRLPDGYLESPDGDPIRAPSSADLRIGSAHPCRRGW